MQKEEYKREKDRLEDETGTVEREGRDELDFLGNDHRKEMDEKEREFREKSQ